MRVIARSLRNSKGQANPMRDTASERAYGTAGGAKPRRVNPIGGTEMKQARQVVGGARRREGVKP
jgi:hypothetical protein